VAVQPSQFAVPADEAITAELNKKYANRVLHDIGLCICVFDLSQVGEGKVRYGDGCIWYKSNPNPTSSYRELTWGSCFPHGHLQAIHFGSHYRQGQIFRRGRDTLFVSIFHLMLLFY
jgi:hypothetical protein